jgi:hypothetical protein
LCPGIQLRKGENHSLQLVFRPKREEITEGWRKLHNEELHNTYSSSNVMRSIKSRRIKLVGHKIRMRESLGMHTGFWWEDCKERDH